MVRDLKIPVITTTTTPITSKKSLTKLPKTNDESFRGVWDSRKLSKDYGVAIKKESA